MPLQPGNDIKEYPLLRNIRLINNERSLKQFHIPKNIEKCFNSFVKQNQVNQKFTLPSVNNKPLNLEYGSKIYERYPIYFFDITRMILSFHKFSRLLSIFQFFLPLFFTRRYIQFNKAYPLTYVRFLIAMGLSCVSVQALKNDERTEISWGNNACTTKFSVETRLEHGFQ